MQQNELILVNYFRPLNQKLTIMERHLLHSDKYLDIYYDQGSRFIEYYWKKATEDMTEAEYRMLIMDILDMVDEKGWRPAYYLLDNRDFLFTLSPKLQEWQKKYPAKKSIELGVKKAAMVMSENFVSQFSIEQTFEDDKEVNALTQYFSDIEEAKEWLQSTGELI